MSHCIRCRGFAQNGHGPPDVVTVRGAWALMISFHCRRETMHQRLALGEGVWWGTVKKGVLSRVPSCSCWMTRLISGVNRLSGMRTAWVLKTVDRRRRSCSVTPSEDGFPNRNHPAADACTVENSSIARALVTRNMIPMRLTCATAELFFWCDVTGGRIPIGNALTDVFRVDTLALHVCRQSNSSSGRRHLLSG